jgi:broad specificity phosphatase PhoE
MSRGHQKNSINLIFIRHAHSCGNAKEFSSKNKLYKLVKLQTRNPPLSDLGLIQVQHARETVPELKNVDVVYSSEMVRALETAAHLFPTHHIRICPFVAEVPSHQVFVSLNIDLENAPESKEKTLARLENLNYDISRFNYELYDKFTTPTKPTRPSPHKFWANVVIRHWLNPESPFCLLGQTVALITHSHLINEILKGTVGKSWLFEQKPKHMYHRCKHVDYKPETLSVGNVGMISFAAKLYRNDENAKANSKVKPSAKPKADAEAKPTIALARATLLYENNAVFDEVSRSCVSFKKKKRAINQGRKEFVQRCGEHIRNIQEIQEIQ